jgi:hypothetical protein
MDHVNHEEFDNYILVHFANNRTARFDLVNDEFSGKKYLHPRGEYTDDQSECWAVIPFGVYLANKEDVLHIRFVKN